MKSTRNWLAPLAGSLLVVTTAALVVSTTAVAQTVNGQKVSKTVAVPLKAAQDAVKARRYSEASAKLKEVDAIPNKTPYEQFMVNEMTSYVAYATKNYSEAARAEEASLNSGQAPQSEIPKRTIRLLKLSYQIKNYPKVLELGDKAIKGGFANDEVYTLMAQTYYLQGNYKRTQQFVEGYIKDQSKPKEEMLKFVMSACDKLHDTGCMTRTLEKMIANYPKPEYWQGVLSSMLASSEFSDRNRLQLFRLATEVDVLKRSDDYTEMAQLAQEQGAYAEAERILQKAFEKKVFTDQRSIDKNNRLLASIQKGMAQDKASLPQRAQAAAASPNGDDDVNVGIAYLSYQQFPEAIKVLQNSLTKPLTDPKPRTANEIKLLIGVAQLEAGDKQGAVKTFREVKNDPQLERLASLWSLRARQT
jgi:hypothetical protein